ncbi:Gar1/Naf1 family protein [Thermococcus sp.]|uniref:Gar1/Naf1 family protein n=1 Tax=Thermococcus sp. TaxID=35749 RepID=UPI00260F6A0F|nr:Gar1/Naf1 family protein [Thermococcus sp.]
MKRLGKVSHYAKQGFLIVRTNWVPSLNEPVVDKDLKPVGIVKDVFGPVDYPYVAVKPRVKNPEKYVGALLYVDKRKRGKKSSKKAKAKKTKDSRRVKRSRPAPRRRG